LSDSCWGLTQTKTAIGQWTIPLFPPDSDQGLVQASEPDTLVTMHAVAWDCRPAGREPEREAPRNVPWLHGPQLIKLLPRQRR